MNSGSNVHPGETVLFLASRAISHFTTAPLLAGRPMRVPAPLISVRPAVGSTFDIVMSDAATYVS